jgi:phospholipid/cholesterol/gamma-HCH transport system substrate-binding protein
MADKKLNPEERERRVVVRAGLFLFIGAVIAFGVVFLLGKERNLFDTKVSYKGAFENVDGLALDAPVRLGGLQAGRVSAISFAPDLGDKRIIVTMEIAAKFKERVRHDSVARIASRGVLGDKAIDISLGSPESPALGSGEEIETGSSGDLSSFLKASGEIIDNVTVISRDLRGAVANYSDPELKKDVAGLFKSARNIAGEIETGKGALHAVVYDKATAEELKQLIGAASSAAMRLDNAAGTVDKLLADVKTGDGTLHALIYDKKIAGAFSELGTAAGEVASLINDAKKSPNSAVHQLVYGDSRELFADLSTAVKGIKDMVDKVQRGEGTLGGVINDPTVYEDLKEILGNVKRNALLRALVRFSISNNGEREAIVEESGKPKPEAKK